MKSLLQKYMTPFKADYARVVQDTPCQPRNCGGSIMYPRSPEQAIRPKGVPRAKQVVLQEAKEFIDNYYKSSNK